jgi:lipoic acid synthetase
VNKLNILPPNPDEKACGRFPLWLHQKLPETGESFHTEAILQKYRLNTVCEEAKCPNRHECFAKKTATFLALGKECTRNCGFCDIDFAKTPSPPEEDEPERIARSVEELGLKHVVITMVARDDLPDQGAHHIAAIVRWVRKINPQVTIELLTSDFSGDTSLLEVVLAERPEIFNHNLETVRSLSPRIRHKANYARTLAVLRWAKQSQKVHFVKSGIMLGLGEREEEVEETIRDLHRVGCDIITIGQYLQASRRKLRVQSFIPPAQFQKYATFGHHLGVPHMYCGPLVRSSYNAALFVPDRPHTINSL